MKRHKDLKPNRNWTTSTKVEKPESKRRLKQPCKVTRRRNGKTSWRKTMENTKETKRKLKEKPKRKGMHTNKSKSNNRRSTWTAGSETVARNAMDQQWRTTKQRNAWARKGAVDSHRGRGVGDQLERLRVKRWGVRFGETTWKPSLTNALNKYLRSECAIHKIEVKYSVWKNIMRIV